MNLDVYDIFAIAGFLLIVAGVAWMSPPLSLIVAGGLLMAAGIVGAIR